MTAGKMTYKFQDDTETGESEATTPKDSTEEVEDEGEEAK